MKKRTTKSKNAKRLLASLLVIVLLTFVFAGCASGSGKNGGYYSKSEKAISALEDAVWILDRCLDEKIDVEECVEELRKVEREYEPYCEEDSILKLVVLSISVEAGSISTTEISRKLGSASMATVMRKVQEARDEFSDMIKR